MNTVSNENSQSAHGNSGSTEDARFSEIAKVASVRVFHTVVGGMSNNVYLLVDEQAPDNSLLVDAADEADSIADLVEFASDQLAAPVAVRTIVTTHSHDDHVQALDDLMQRWQPTHVTSELDAPDIPVAADRTLAQGDTVTFGAGVDLDAFILRGHTTGGVGLALNGGDTAGGEANDPTCLFVGDSLFPGGVGKTESDAAFAQLIDDAEQRIFNTYPDSARVLPGHGDATTVGAERPELPQWRARGW